jgi:hypothetical protein
MRKVIALDSHKGATDWTQQLGAGLEASQPVVRQYCIDAVYRDIGRKDPGAALAMLTGHLAHAVNIHFGPIETYSTVNHIVAIGDTTKDARLTASAIYSLALCSASTKEPDGVRWSALQSLAQMVVRPTVPRAAEIFSKQDLSSIRKGLEHPARSRDAWEEQKAIVFKWFAASTDSSGLEKGIAPKKG